MSHPLDSVFNRRNALRVPSIIPDRWVYLRTWNSYGQADGGVAGERTHASSAWVVAAHDKLAFVTLLGLKPMLFEGIGNFIANANTLDAYLFSLGAEIVPPGEWPENSVGAGYRLDRAPLRFADWSNDLYREQSQEIDVIKAQLRVRL